MRERLWLVGHLEAQLRNTGCERRSRDLTSCLDFDLDYCLLNLAVDFTKTDDVVTYVRRAQRCVKGNRERRRVLVDLYVDCDSRAERGIALSEIRSICWGTTSEGETPVLTQVAFGQLLARSTLHHW